MAPLQWRWIRRAGLAIYAGLALYQYFRGLPWTSKGLPLEREQLIGWMLAGSIVWSLGRDRREVLYAVAGWGALAACFVLYDYSRGAIDNLWGHPVLIPGTGSTAPQQAVHNASRVITAEKALFFGNLPNEWMQDRLYPKGRKAPHWEIITAFTYLSHFITVYVIALFQWIRNKKRWMLWVRSLTTLIFLGVLGYLVYPTAPPWMAGSFGLMDKVARPGTRALGYVHLHYADRLWNKGAASTNLVAAMPSLHFAFTVLAALFFWREASKWLRVILVAYPCLMLFTLSYGGEHYVMDCLAGGLLAWLAVWGNRRVDRWWLTRTTRPTADAATDYCSS